MGQATQEASEESQRAVAVIKKGDELNQVEFIKDNVLLYNNRLVGYKDPYKRDGIWDKFCTENKMDNTACTRWFQSQRTMHFKIAHMKSGQGAPYFTDKQNWLKKNLGLLHNHIICRHSSKSAFRAPHQQKNQMNPQFQKPVQWNQFMLAPRGSTNVPLRCTPSQNHSINQPCASPTMNGESSRWRPRGRKLEAEEEETRGT